MTHVSRRFGLLLGSFALLATMLSGAGRHITVRADAVATVTPDSGALGDQYTFAVSGLTSGNTVRIAITDSAGTAFQLADTAGNPLVLVVQTDGTVIDQMTPTTDAPTAVPGTWTASFEEIETGANTTISFTVTS